MCRAGCRAAVVMGGVVPIWRVGKSVYKAMLRPGLAWLLRVTALLWDTLGSGYVLCDRVDWPSKFKSDMFNHLHSF
jgi:hypothetical protein